MPLRDHHQPIHQYMHKPGGNLASYPKLNQASPVENSPGCQKYVAAKSEFNGGTPFVGIIAPFL
jgi:hypothetical protein